MRFIPENSELPGLVRSPLGFLQRHSIPLGLVVLSAVADGWTTLVNMRRYGTDIELHPAQRFISLIFGVTMGVPLAKLIQAAFVLLVSAWWKPACNPLLYLCALLYVLAALNNHFLWL